MLILDISESEKKRRQYITTFINTESNYYNNFVEKMCEYSDGLYYKGYLWDCLKHSKVISEDCAMRFLEKQKKVYIMWDKHSIERLAIHNYLIYPKERVLLTTWSAGLLQDLPEDIYLFDESFAWSLVFTHETDNDGNRFCLMTESRTLAFFEKHHPSCPDP